MASCNIENKASIKVLEKNKMQLEGHLIKARYKNGRWVDELVFGRLNMKTDRILFFDDSQENVDAARLAGMQAERVDGPDGVRQVLMDFGLYDK